MEAVELYRGMQASEIVAAIGTPDEVEAPEEGAEVWVYRKIDEKVTLNVTSTESFKLSSGANDLVTGYSISQYEPEFQRRTEETRFLVIDGTLVAWKQDVEQED